MHDSIILLATGGTIDDLEYDDEKNAPIRRQSLLPTLLTQPMRVQTLMQKDSQFISDADREKMLEAIRLTPESKILLTHGTKTMSETARYLGQKVSDKTVVITGCMILPSKDEGADARRHLEFALSRIASLPVGVFVLMNNTVFDWDNVRKNVEKGKFETLK